jgi:hypothetical protein
MNCEDFVPVETRPQLTETVLEYVPVVDPQVVVEDSGPVPTRVAPVWIVAVLDTLTRLSA